MRALDAEAMIGSLRNGSFLRFTDDFWKLRSRLKDGNLWEMEPHHPMHVTAVFDEVAENGWLAPGVEVECTLGCGSHIMTTIRASDLSVMMVETGAMPIERLTEQQAVSYCFSGEDGSTPPKRALSLAAEAAYMYDFICKTTKVKK